MIIGLDMDGVLCNFYQAYEEVIANVTGRNLFPPGIAGVDRFPAEWDWPQAAGYTGEEITKVWAGITQDPLWWLSLKPLAGVDEFLHSLRFSDTIYAITDRPGTDVQHQTAAWLRHRGAPPQVGVVLSNGKSKGAICKALGVDVILDDKWENIRSVMEASRKTKAVLMKRPYNERGWDRAPHAVKSLGEFRARFL